MSDESCYIVEFAGERYDYLKSAKKVLICYQHQVPFTAEELALLAMRGKYIRVDDLRDMERNELQMLLSRVTLWAQAPSRMRQLLDPDVRKMRPYVELVVDGECCAKAAAKSGRFLPLEEIEPLPLRGCWRVSCWCDYRTHSRSDLARRSNADEAPKAI